MDSNISKTICQIPLFILFLLFIGYIYSYMLTDFTLTIIYVFFHNVTLTNVITTGWHRGFILSTTFFQLAFFLNQGAAHLELLLYVNHKLALCMPPEIMVLYIHLPASTFLTTAVYSVTSFLYRQREDYQFWDGWTLLIVANYFKLLKSPWVNKSPSKQ